MSSGHETGRRCPSSQACWPATIWAVAWAAVFNFE
jgi:hypothetical protein